MPDWSSIKQEYEQGASLRTLAAKYGVSKSLIGKKKFEEQWAEKRLTVDAVDKVMDMRPPVHFPISPDVVTIADLLLGQIATHLQGTLEIKDIKSASDALAACAKVKLAYPQEEQEPQDGLLIPYDQLSAHARMEIRRIVAEDQREEQTG